MLYWKYSPNRVFFLNEYWIFIPSAILANYFIIRKIRSHKKKIQLLKKLNEQLERERKIRRILYLSFGLNALNASAYAYILIRGGTDLIDVDYILSDFKIDEGVGFLDDRRLRKIVISLYRHKRKGQIIYITATAIAQLANRYGQHFLALPFAIGDFGVTNIYQGVRKGFVTFLFSIIAPLYLWAGPIAVPAAILLATTGLRLAFNNLDVIPTSPILETDSFRKLRPRIPGSTDVVVINCRDRNRIIMSNPVEKNQECWLPAQLNPNCNPKVNPSEIPTVLDSCLPDLNYDDVVNMQDVTGLDRIGFTDLSDLGQTEPSIPEASIPESQKGKMVNFLDKFGDSGKIDDKDTWDVGESTVPERRYLRTRNEL